MFFYELCSDCFCQDDIPLLRRGGIAEGNDGVGLLCPCLSTTPAILGLKERKVSRLLSEQIGRRIGSNDRMARVKSEHYRFFIIKFDTLNKL
ncbi:MAG: hypothetical protein IT281_04685 [Ignavibacteria bacterium]|nr:hypothetical protein [Ignavibacteria bacterium]